MRSLYFCFKKRNLYFISPPNLMEYHFCTKTIVVHAYSPRSFLNLKVKGSNCFRGFHIHVFSIPFSFTKNRFNIPSSPLYFFFLCSFIHFRCAGTSKLSLFLNGFHRQGHGKARVVASRGT